MSFWDSGFESGSDYALALRHASSAGGTRASDEDWTTLSWYGTIHNLQIDYRTTVGIGMSKSQKDMWLLLSKVAYERAVFPESFFDADHMIIADVNNVDLWFLLHEMTRKTYKAELDVGMGVEWFLVFENEHSRTWNLYLTYPDNSAKLEYSHWRGNTAKQAHVQLEERKSTSAPGSIWDRKSTSFITTRAYVNRADTMLPIAYPLAVALLIIEGRLTKPELCETNTPFLEDAASDAADWEGEVSPPLPTLTTKDLATQLSCAVKKALRADTQGASDEVIDSILEGPALRFRDHVGSFSGRIGSVNDEDIEKAPKVEFLGIGVYAPASLANFQVMPNCGADPAGPPSFNSSTSFDIIAKNLKAEATGLDIREEELIERETKVARREKAVLEKEAVANAWNSTTPQGIPQKTAELMMRERERKVAEREKAVSEREAALMRTGGSEIVRGQDRQGSGRYVKGSWPYAS